MTLDLPEIEKIENKLDEIKRLLGSPFLEKAWYTSEDCWKLKGGCALSTFKAQKQYQCKGGRPDAYVGGRKVWSRESVAEWLQVTDEKLPEYLKGFEND